MNEGQRAVCPSTSGLGKHPAVEYFSDWHIVSNGISTLIGQ